MTSLRKIRTFFIGALALSALLLAWCSPKMNDGGTQTGNPAIAGILYNPDHTRAAHATVTLIPSGYNPHGSSLSKTLSKTIAATAAALDSTTTDDTGGYRFSTIPSDTCNILSSDNGNLCFHDSVIVPPDSHTIVPPDTLKAPGSLTGIVQLQGTDDPRTVFIIFLGTGTVETPADTTGTFTIPNLAQGSYHVRFLTTTPNYKVLDTNLSIIAGKIDTLPKPIQMQYTGIPVPGGLHIQYDSMKEIVTLIWNKPTTGRAVKSYNIYRANIDSNKTPAILNATIVIDTTYQDSTGVQDMSYEYYVTAVDTTGGEGTKSAGVSVKVVSVFKLIQTIELDSLSSDQISFAMAKDTTFYVAYNIGNGGSFIGVFDKTGKNTAIIGKGKFIQLYDIAIDSKNNIYAADLGGNKIIKFNINGDSIAQWPVPTPARILIDSQNSLFVLNNYKPYYLTKFDTLGNILALDTTVPFFYEYAEFILGPGGDIITKNDITSQLVTYDNNLILKNTSSFTFSGDLRAIDNLGNIYAEDEIHFNIIVYNSIGTKIAKWHSNLPFYPFWRIGARAYILGYGVNHLINVYSIPFLE